MKKTENCHVEEILKFINKNEDIKIIIQWIPSHVGILGNEKADKLAKEGTTEKWVIKIKFTITEAYNELKKKLYEEWAKEYKEISKEKGKEYYKIEKTPRTETWFKNYRGTTKEIKTLNRIRTNHYISNKKLKLFKISETENCEECNEIEDIDHILLKCIKHKNIRENNMKIRYARNVLEMIKEAKYINYEAIHMFIKKADIRL